MDLGPLRALVTALNFAAHGVDATVTVPGDDPVETRGIWLLPVTDGLPTGIDFRRASVKRVMAFRRSDIPQVPRGTIIVAAERSGDVEQRWLVDGIEKIEADHIRAMLVPSPETES